MMRQYELVERVTRYNPSADENLLNKAYVYAMQKHGTQRRANGDPYFSHPLEVAGILTDLKLDDATIVAALLHDTIEDTDATRSEIDSTFGEDIGRLVEGLTKIQKLDLVSKKAAQAENLRKLLLAISEDVRVLLVKLADRLHNMRTLEFMPEESRKRNAEETLEIYAPLAGRMGMHDMREELEELAFRVVNPEAHATITERLAEQRDRNKSLIAQDREGTHGGPCRERRQGPGIGPGEAGLLDLPQDGAEGGELRATLGHHRFSRHRRDGSGMLCGAWRRPQHLARGAGRFKDYISTAKQNDYRSIHTTVIGPGQQRVELQIRTAQMDRIAEYGIAAHALYKDGVAAKPKVNGGGNGRSGAGASDEIHAYEWLRRTVEMLAEGDTPEEFLEHTKLELFQDQVFCFTPKGRLIALPRGATPIDFAYAVHTDIGDTCVGAKINGRTMPLMTDLHNGDEVEIIRSKAQVPSAAWSQWSSPARRARPSGARRVPPCAGSMRGSGGEILERAFERARRPFNDQMLVPVLPRLAQSNVEDMLSAVGRGEIPSNNVVKAVYPDHKEERPSRRVQRNEEGWSGLRRAGLRFRVPGFSRKTEPERGGGDRPIPIRGLIGRRARPLRRGRRAPGERIVGIASPGEGVTIYPIGAQALKAFDDQPERWLDVRWDVEEVKNERFPARIEATAINEPGTLAQIAQVIADSGANISNLRITKAAPDFSVMVIDVEVFDVKHLTRLITQLRAKPVVSSVVRANA